MSWYLDLFPLIRLHLAIFVSFPGEPSIVGEQLGAAACFTLSHDGLHLLYRMTSHIYNLLRELLIGKSGFHVRPSAGPRRARRCGDSPSKRVNPQQIRHEFDRGHPDLPAPVPQARY